MKLTTQKTIQNPNSQMMSLYPESQVTKLFDENDIYVGEIYNPELGEHIVKCVNSHDAMLIALGASTEALLTAIDVMENNGVFTSGIYQAAIEKIEQALKAAGETV